MCSVEEEGRGTTFWRPQAPTVETSCRPPLGGHSLAPSSVSQSREVAAGSCGWGSPLLGSLSEEGAARRDKAGPSHSRADPLRPRGPSSGTFQVIQL